ncbi:hypothetical protein [Moorena sp. SIO1G6]|nr:hypothetical protein [Moorena sp. SIO1G6]
MANLIRQRKAHLKRHRARVSSLDRKLVLLMVNQQPIRSLGW